VGKPIVRIASFMLAVFVILAAAYARAAETQPVTVKVMTFNIWLGGDQVNFGKVIEAIKASDADIVCLQEAGGQTLAIAEALGWSYAAPNRHVIARVPLFVPTAETQGADGNDLDTLYAEVVPGGFVAIANIHLPSDTYGPYELRVKKSVAEVLETEKSLRLTAIEPYIAPLAAAAKAGTPVVLAGDFNSPGLDWSPAIAQRWPQAKEPIAWPAAKALIDAGFTDSYRAIHPDAAAKPGITWSYGYPYPHLDADEQQDRIDLTMVLGPVKPVKSEILGDPHMPDTDIGVSPWPSDHRAVVSTFEVVPGPAPAMVQIDKRVALEGGIVRARFHAAAGDGRLEGGRVVIIKATAAADAAPLVSLASNNGTDRSNSVDFGTVGLKPGAYAVALRDADGKELARAPFWILARGDQPVVSTDKAKYAPGEDITVTFANGPGNRYDWLGIYKKGEPADDNYQSFFYVNAAANGSLKIDKAMLGDALAPGEYEMRLELDDGYTRLASTPFRVE
jgi:exonuclease III